MARAFGVLLGAPQRVLIDFGVTLVVVQLLRATPLRRVL
jgi:hypothetical protein